MIKIIGIGNILLCDDGIGVRVVEEMKKNLLEINEQVAVLVGETDFYYCLDNIDSGDFIILVDSTYLGIEPGRITVLTLNECDKYVDDFTTEHGDNLVDILRREHREINGYLIGIEAGRIEFSLELSSVLQEKFQDICLSVCGEINDIVKDYFKIA